MTSQVSLKRVDATFAPQLAKLWARTFAEAYIDEHSAGDIQTYSSANFTESAARETLNDPTIECTFAFRNEEAVGYTVIRHVNAPYPLEAPSSELKQIYVIADEFGTGTGRQLFHNALQSIQQAGRVWVWLLVSDRNFRAQAFYKKHEFACIGTGTLIHVGQDTLTSSILAKKILPET